MECNSDKLEAMNVVKPNQGETCPVNGRALENVVEQRDLGVQVHIPLTVTMQVDGAMNGSIGKLPSSVKVWAQELG